MNPISISDLILGSLPTIIVVSLIWLVPAFLLFSHIRKNSMEETAKAVWVLVILLLPIVGPLTYWLLKREDKK
jgi:heme/copper-type cytochrome/quinol oxidase subunit 4